MILIRQGCDRSEAIDDCPHDLLSALVTSIQAVHKIINKLPVGFANVFGESLESYARHIRNSDHSVKLHIIFPVAFSKLEDKT
jgi:hypothetical protein